MTEVADASAGGADEAEVVAPTAQLVPVQQRSALATNDVLSVAELVARRSMVVEAMRDAMQEGVHYGRVPGVSKPTLLKPGAELLNVLFKFAPLFPDERMQLTRYEGGHMDVVATCVVTHFPTGLVVAEGKGMCSTRESKYAYRKAARTCPGCGKETIKPSKYPPRNSPAGTPGGWYCDRKDGGCGNEYHRDAPEVAQQDVDRRDNPDLADQYNTVLKMACKRAMIDGNLHATGASDVFTQDVGDGAATVPPDDTPFEAATGHEQASAPVQQPAATPQAAQQATGPQAAPAVGDRPTEPQLADKDCGQLLNYLNAKQPGWRWGAMFAAVAKAYLPSIPVQRFGDYPPAAKDDLRDRLAQAVVYLMAEVQPGLGLSPSQIQACLARAFDGHAVDVPPWEGGTEDQRLAAAGQALVNEMKAATAAATPASPSEAVAAAPVAAPQAPTEQPPVDNGGLLGAALTGELGGGLQQAAADALAATAPTDEKPSDEVYEAAKQYVADHKDDADDPMRATAQSYIELYERWQRYEATLAATTGNEEITF